MQYIDPTRLNPTYGSGYGGWQQSGQSGDRSYIDPGALRPPISNNYLSDPSKVWGQGTGGQLDRTMSGDPPPGVMGGGSMSFMPRGALGALGGSAATGSGVPGGQLPRPSWTTDAQGRNCTYEPASGYDRGTDTATSWKSKCEDSSLGGMGTFVNTALTGIGGVIGGPVAAAGVRADLASNAGPGSRAPRGGADDPGGGEAGTGVGAPGMLGGLLGGGLQLAGTNQANLAYQEAQRRAQDAGNFTPYNVFSGLGSTTSGPGGITSALSPQYQALRDQYLGNAGAGAAAAGSFDPNQMANQFYGQLQAQAAPGEAEQRANAIAQLQGMGQLGLGVGADTGNGPANPLFSSLLKAQADAARQRQISSYGLSQDMANQMQQRALGWGGAGLGLDQSQLQQQQLGAYLGGLSSNAALGGARLAQGPILARGLTRGGVLSGAGGVLSSGNLPPWLQQMLGSGNAGGVFGGAVDQYGNPTQGNFQGGPGSVGGGDFYNPGADFSPPPTEFDPGTDWSSLYG